MFFPFGNIYIDIHLILIHSNCIGIFCSCLPVVNFASCCKINRRLQSSSYAWVVISKIKFNLPIYITL